ncbi:MAG: DNA-binding protein Alba [Candidatus Helarchaeota archaeon]|nr:DNA-binding protein Alba [Candidatus Helarchaeota archaeon]
MSDRKKDDIVFIGQKTAMNYVMACLTVIQSGFKEVTLKARGKAISRAVDVAEILRNRFMKDKIELKKIETGTEVLEREDQGKFSVSTIDIVLKLI